MVYASNYNYLTVHWASVETPAETGQFGLKFVGGPAADQSSVNNCKGAVQAMWINPSMVLPIFFTLQYLRLATIGPDGKYLPGSIAYDGIYSPAVAGVANGSNARQPLQVAHAISLTTATPRGHAHRGRVYVPTLGSTFISGPVWSAADCLNRANAFSAMLSALNAVGIGTLNVMSKIGAGVSHPVTGIAVGNRADVQRRRAKSQVETYSVAAV